MAEAEQLRAEVERLRAENAAVRRRAEEEREERAREVAALREQLQVVKALLLLKNVDVTMEGGRRAAPRAAAEDAGAAQEEAEGVGRVQLPRRRARAQHRPQPLPEQRVPVAIKVLWVQRVRVGDQVHAM